LSKFISTVDLNREYLLEKNDMGDNFNHLRRENSKAYLLTSHELSENIEANFN